MRNEVESKGVACRKYLVNWTENGIMETTHGEYMNELGEHVKTDLLNSIKIALDNIPKLSPCLEEAANTHDVLQQTSKYVSWKRRFGQRRDELLRKNRRFERTIGNPWDKWIWQDLFNGQTCNELQKYSRKKSIITYQILWYIAWFLFC